MFAIGDLAYGSCFMYVVFEMRGTFKYTRVGLMSYVELEGLTPKCTFLLMYGKLYHFEGWPVNGLGDGPKGCLSHLGI